DIEDFYTSETCPYKNDSQLAWDTCSGGTGNCGTVCCGQCFSFPVSQSCAGMADSNDCPNA
uniref:Mating pheromone En-2 n=2 Tax=Euplotes nobilii TaxID=184062 RepID=MEN2_EUPNO|nr:RecName: Full=Mating pheromone En-2 [Euplotes nobilii]2NSW_A Chain A, Mating pheromone En-2 [Euplotes nobilii]